jgi:hypothetical protein
VSSAPCNLRLLPSGLVLDVACIDPDAIDERLVDHRRSILGNRADRVLRVSGRSDLACNEHIEIAADPFTHHGSDRDAPAGDAEHERSHIRVENAGLDHGVGEPNRRIGTIAIPHIPSVLATPARTR